MNDNIEAEVRRHLHHLAVEIGSRPVGTEANRKAETYIQSAFIDAGLSVKNLKFDFPDWSEHETVLELEGESLKAAANTFSPSCDVSAATVVISTIAELEAAELEGKIAVMCGALTQAPLLPKNYTIYQTEEAKKINALLDEKFPVAIITINQKMYGMERIIEDKDQFIPSVTVPSEVGLQLLDHAGETVHLKIDTRRENGLASHVIGTKTGSRPERIVLCAHYDTKIETPGAWDNASGVASLLTLASILGPQSLDVSLEFVAFNDEEYTGMDDREYSRQRGDQLDTVLAAINIDGIGQRLGTNTIMMVENSEAFKTLVTDLTQAYPGLVWVDPWPASNHSTFSWRGVPSLAFSSLPNNIRMHNPTDTVEWIGSDKLAEVISIVSDIVMALQDKLLEWARPAK
jgi:aminopeptidase YwaD